MSSSYRIGTGVSRRWDGDFCWEQPRPTPWLGPPWKEESRLLLPGHWRHLSEQTRLHPAERHSRGLIVRLRKQNHSVYEIRGAGQDSHH